jgi:hypothetical protein
MPASGAGAAGAAPQPRIPALRLLVDVEAAEEGRAALDALAPCGPASADAAAPAEEACAGGEDAEEEEGGALACAFCLEGADEGGGGAKSVRAPCGACAGTLARVHVDCLRHDLEARAHAHCTPLNTRTRGHTRATQR